MIIGLILVLIFLCFILIRSADHVVIALRRIARKSHIGVFAFSAIILALGTSFPELGVSLTSALNGMSSLSLGVVLGSNIANVALVGASAALLYGRVVVRGEFLRRDYWIATAAGILPMILALDGRLTRVDGLVLLIVYLAYATSLFKHRFLEIAEGHRKNEPFWYRIYRQISRIDGHIGREYGRLFIGLSVMLLSADLCVRVARTLASSLGIPIFIVGLVVVAIGTSLPEFAFSIRSLEDKEPKMFFGNLLGSTIANSTLILGLAIVISPINAIPINQYLISAVTYLGVYLLLWLFIETKFRLDRWEAAVLLLVYLVFVIAELF